jgi:hypothetical protein
MARSSSRACGKTARPEGFTISEFDPTKLLTPPFVDQARKHQQRPPDDVRTMTARRRRSDMFFDAYQRTIVAARSA